MTPPRRTPSGLETPASRGPYRYHESLDCSCQFEMEDIPFGSGGFSRNLCDDMGWRGVAYLTKHYPELVFQFIRGKKPGGHDYVQSVKGGHVVADWRTA